MELVELLIKSPNVLATIGAIAIAGVIWSIRAVWKWFTKDISPWAKHLTEKVTNRHVDFLDSTQKCNESNAKALETLTRTVTADREKTDATFDAVHNLPCRTGIYP